jgi:hypothetical protein
MKQILYILIALGFVSCHNSNSLDKYFHELPDSTLINNVIEAVIQIDSINLDYDIVINIKQTKIYSQPKWDNDSVPPPPPPPQSITFEALFEQFDSKSDNEKRQNDSIFFCVQKDTARKFNINYKLYSRFNHNTDKYYKFFMPIFSFDKRFVFVQYWRHCGRLCGNCHVYILKWTGTNWVRICDWGCGRS